MCAPGSKAKSRDVTTSNNRHHSVPHFRRPGNASPPTTPSSASSSPSSSTAPLPPFRPDAPSYYPSAPSTPTRPRSAPSASPARSNARFPVAAAATPSSPAHRLKLKTEMCRAFRSTKGCPFGDRCHFAHSDQELKEVKVVDLHRAGIIKSVDAYRVRPCMSYVSTGSCPFENRCCDLHDPRITGPVQSWLPHCERPVQKIDTDIFVANLHHQLANTVSHGTPFAELIPKDVLQQSRPAEEGDDSTEAVPESKRLTDWNQFYEGICSGKDANKGSATGTGSAGRKDDRPPSDLSERQRLEIALKMRGNAKTDRHKYYPNNEMMKETCMVLQTRAFRIEEGKSAIEVLLGFAGAANRGGRGDESKTIVVREVAFGNDADPSVRGVALWFGVPSSEVISRVGTVRTHEEKRKARTSHEAKTTAVIDEYLGTTANKPFYLVRPKDEDAFNLTTSILVHRLQTLQAAEMKSCKVQRDEFTSLNAEEGRIRSSFESLCRHWASGAWDATTGRPAKVDEETPRPRVDERYYQTKPKPTCASITGRPIDSQKSGEGHKTKMTSHVWDSFVQEMRHVDAGEAFPSPVKSSRLDAFVALSRGISMAPADRSEFPRMKKQVIITPMQHAACPARTRCWREALQMHHLNGENEWGKVYHYYTRQSRQRAMRNRI